MKIKLFVIALFVVLTTLFGGAAPVLAVTGDSIWYVPLAMNNNNGWNSQIWAYNNSSNTEDIYFIVWDSVTIICQPWIPNVPPNSWAQFNLISCPNNSIFGGRVLGFVAGTNTPANIVATIRAFSANSSTEYTAIPSSTVSTVAYSQGIHSNNSGWNGDLVIFNPTGVTATYDITWGNSSCTNTSISIASGGVAVVWASSYCPAGAIYLAAKVVGRSGAPSVLMSGNYQNNQFQYYAGVSSGGTAVSIPRVMRNYYGTSTSTNCANVGISSTNITISYASGGSTTISGVAILGAVGMYQGNDANLIDGAITSATVTASQPLVCIVSGGDWSQPTTNPDWMWAYNPQDGGFGQTSSHGVALDDAATYLSSVGARWYHQWNWNTTTSGDIEGIPLAEEDWECWTFPYATEPHACNRSDQHNAPINVPVLSTASLYAIGANEITGCSTGGDCLGWATYSDATCTQSGTAEVCTYSSDRAARLIHAAIGAYPNRKWLAPSILGTNYGTDDLTSLRNQYYTLYGAYPPWSGLEFHCNNITDCINALSSYTTLATNWGIGEVWVTEFATNSGCSSSDAGSLRNVMKSFANNSLLTHYSYTHSTTYFCKLWDSGGNLTTVGKAYWLYR